MTAVRNPDRYREHHEAAPLSRVIVFGIVAFAFALFPAPIEAGLSLILPGIGAHLATWLTWGLVILWIALALKVAVSGGARRTV